MNGFDVTEIHFHEGRFATIIDAKITLILHHEGRFAPREADGKVEYVGGEFDI